MVNMTGIYPAAHPLMQQVLRPWADALLEETGGRLVIRFFEPLTIADPGNLGRAVRFGQAGIGLGFISAEPEDFPLSILAAHGPGSASLRELSSAYWRMYTEIPELAGEFYGIKLLAVYATDPVQFCMTSRLLYDAESLRGSSFLVESALTSESLESFGAVPKIAPQADFKMLMEDKIADGLAINLTDITRLGLKEHVGTIALGDFENGAVWLGMHQGVWDMLPQDIRNILSKNSGLELSQTLGEALGELYRAELEALGNSAVRLHYFSSEERGKFYRNMRSIAQEGWQVATRGKGYNIKALQDKISKIMTETKARQGG